MKHARVVIIMPVYNEARHLPQVLGSIGAQTFDHSRLFFVGVDGDSRDGSADVLRAWLTRSGMAGCVISNSRRKIPIGLNLGLQAVLETDIIVRLDAHTIYGSTYIAEAVGWLETVPSDVACVGCAQWPLPGSTFEERMVEALYTNPMGLGGADFRFGNDVREVDHVYLGVWRPGILIRAGGFNESLEANEDGEMSARLRQMGYRILRVPLPCRFVLNRGLVASIRQWNRYGYWRARMLRQNPAFIRRRHVLAPGAAILSIALACSPLRLLLLPAFAVYAVLVFRGRARGESFGVTLATLLYFPALHYAFAAGMLTSLFARRGEGARTYPRILAQREP
jgi:glycosyltransferase involved in cell wall biosynthesis